jgi:hypothetical protein
MLLAVGCMNTHAVHACQPSHIPPQVLNYGIVLRLNDGKLGIKHLMRMLDLLLMISGGRGGSYCHSVIMQLLVVQHQYFYNLPQWQMLKNSMSTYNEEAGEISFSLLSRIVLGDTQQRKFEHMDKCYKLVHMYGAVDRDLEHDRTSKFRKDNNWRRVVGRDSEPVQATVAFVRAKLRAMSQGTFKVYDGAINSFKNGAHAQTHMVHCGKEKPVWVEDTTDLLEFHINKCRKFVVQFAGPFADVWPEMKPQLDPSLLVAGAEEDEFSDHKSSDEEPEEEYEEQERWSDEGPMENSAPKRQRVHPNKAVAWETSSEEDKSGDDEKEPVVAPVVAEGGGAAEEVDFNDRRSHNVDARNIQPAHRGERAGRHKLVRYAGDVDPDDFVIRGKYSYHRKKKDGL